MNRPGPTFLGIGAQRAGTTTLHRALAGHPQVFLPVRRKELHYFDQYYERGEDWYRAFFKGAGKQPGMVAAGEITPRYLYDPRVPARIHAFDPDLKLIAILRNPVDRAFSQYQFAIRDFHERRPFARYAAEEEDVIGRGAYAQQLARYFERFDRDRILVLIFEEVMPRPDWLDRELCRFLGIEPGHMANAGRPWEAENAAYRVRHAAAFARLRRWGVWCRARGLDQVVNAAKAAGLKERFGRGDPLPELDPTMRAELEARYAEDTAQLAGLLGRDLAVWRGAP